MKKAEQYLDGIWETEFDGLDELDYFNILAIIKRAQEEAIRETVKECADNIIVRLELFKTLGDPKYLLSINEESILSITDKLIKEL